MPVEMAVPNVNNKMLEELEDMGFPKARAIRALHYSGEQFMGDTMCVSDVDVWFPNLA